MGAISANVVPDSRITEGTERWRSVFDPTDAAGDGTRKAVQSALREVVAREFHIDGCSKVDVQFRHRSGRAGLHLSIRVDASDPKLRPLIKSTAFALGLAEAFGQAAAEALGLEGEARVMRFRELELIGFESVVVESAAVQAARQPHVSTPVSVWALAIVVVLAALTIVYKDVSTRAHEHAKEIAGANESACKAISDGRIYRLADIDMLLTRLARVTASNKPATDANQTEHTSAWGCSCVPTAQSCYSDCPTVAEHANAKTPASSHRESNSSSPSREVHTASR